MGARHGEGAQANALRILASPSARSRTTLATGFWSRTASTAQGVATSGPPRGRLRGAGASVELGVCAGRTVQERPDNPLAIITETFEGLVLPRRR
jgi:hypothetical protein